MSYMDFAHRYHIQNMEQKHDINTMTYLGTTVPFVGRDGTTVSMTMRMQDLERLSLNDEHYHQLIAQSMEEESIRMSCPAAQAAYEQYQMLLKLAK